MLTQFCPNCNAEEEWHFHSGYCDEDGQHEPDEGDCERCGFQYSQHVKHSLEKQLERFRKDFGRSPRHDRTQ